MRICGETLVVGCIDVLALCNTVGRALDGVCDVVCVCVAALRDEIAGGVVCAGGRKKAICCAADGGIRLACGRPDAACRARAARGVHAIAEGIVSIRLRIGSTVYRRADEAIDGIVEIAVIADLCNISGTVISVGTAAPVGVEYGCSTDHLDRLHVRLGAQCGELFARESLFDNSRFRACSARHANAYEIVGEDRERANDESSDYERPANHCTPPRSSRTCCLLIVDIPAVSVLLGCA